MKKIDIDDYGRIKYSELTACHSSLSDIGTCGVGLELYFRFIKHFGCTFFLLTLLSGISIYFNMIGNNLYPNSTLSNK